MRRHSEADTCHAPLLSALIGLVFACVVSYGVLTESAFSDHFQQFEVRQINALGIRRRIGRRSATQMAAHEQKGKIEEREEKKREGRWLKKVGRMRRKGLLWLATHFKAKREAKRMGRSRETFFRPPIHVGQSARCVLCAQRSCVCCRA